MKRSALKRILFLNPVVLALLCGASAAGLLWVFGARHTEHPAAWGIFALSAYSLASLTAWAVRQGPAWCRQIRTRRAQRTEDERLRRSVVLSLFVNLFFFLYKGITAYVLKSPWLGTLACYSLVLGGARSVMLWGKDPRGDVLRCRGCGLLLMLLAPLAAGMVVHDVFLGRVVAYPEHLLYAVAAYTFYAVIFASVHVFRLWKGTPFQRAAGTASFVTAAVNLFSLQSSLLAVFGEGLPWERGVTLATGCTVTLLVVLCSLRLLFTKQNNKTRSQRM